MDNSHMLKRLNVYIHSFLVFGLVLKMARFLSYSKENHTILRRENIHL